MTDLLALWPMLPPSVLLIVWAVRAENRSRANEVTAATAQRTADRALQDLAVFRERVAQEYVTMAALERIEERIAASIERLGDRFDRWLENHR